MTTSTDPMVTSGKSNGTAKSLRYPLTEDLQAGTILRFASYDRFSPNSEPKEKDEAFIFLPLPDAIPESSSFAINGLDLGIMGALNPELIQRLDSKKDGNFKDAAAAAYEGGKTLVSDLLKSNSAVMRSSLLRGIANVPMLPDGVRKNLQVYAGFVQNPHSTLAFEGVNLRSISLQWRVSARSAAEAQAIKSILDEIKMRAHPEESSSRLTLDYPDMLYISFTGKPAEYLPKYRKAFINEISVNTGGSAGMNFYKDGAPTEVTFSIRATELDIITRNILRGER